MLKVFKYKIESEVEMPEGSDILHFGPDPTEVLCIWALVTEGNPMVKRRFIVRGTGHEIDTMRNKKWVGTCRNDPFMWHLFEEL